MLFFLTGEIQTGKTRWLSELAEELEAAGVGVAGVLAPGVWRARSEKEVAEQAAERTRAAARGARAMRSATRSKGKRADARADESAGASPGKSARRRPDPAGEGCFEKLGIDNVLLPQHERIAFARRGDLAKAEGAHRPESQSARAGLAWEIDDGAVARVNAHFAHLAEEGAGANMKPDAGAAGAKDAGASAGAADAADAGGGTVNAAKPGAGESLLVIDELGRLELLRGEGLVEAMRLLEAGPSRRFPHALVVVRESLLEKAHAVFDDIWQDVTEIAPGDTAHKAVTGLFNYQQKQKSCI